MLFGTWKIARRVTDLEDTCEKLTRQLQALQLEWSDTLDRINHLVGRLAKRAQREAEIVPAPSPEAEPAPDLPPAPGIPLSVWARLDAATRQRLIANGGSRVSRR